MWRMGHRIFEESRLGPFHITDKDVLSPPPGQWNTRASVFTHYDVNPFAKVLFGAVYLRPVAELGDPSLEEANNLVGEFESPVLEFEILHAGRMYIRIYTDLRWAKYESAHPARAPVYTDIYDM